MAHAASPAPVCPPPSDLAADVTPLRHFGAALKPKGQLPILVVGSATMFGADSSAAGDAAAADPAKLPLQPSQSGLPWQAAHALEAALPGLHVTVVLAGLRGLTAQQMLARLQAELPKKPYRLVLWQTGTVDAVDELPPDDFYQALSDGAAAVQAAGADLVLIGPQYSRFLAANANVSPYQDALQAAGGLPGVALFNRFDLMHDWVDAGAIDLERSAKADRPAVAARLHACLGRELARLLLADAKAGVQ